MGYRIITTPHFLSARVGSGKSERSSQLFLVIIVRSLFNLHPSHFSGGWEMVLLDKLSLLEKLHECVVFNHLVPCLTMLLHLE